MCRRAVGLTPFFQSTEKATDLSQMLTMMDRLMENEMLATKWAAREGFGLRRCWDVRDEDDGLYFRFDMPGLEKEDVKVMVDKNKTLVISGEKIEHDESEQSEEDRVGGDVRRYSGRIDLPDEYELTNDVADQIKAEMNKGVLKVFVPRVNPLPSKTQNLIEVKID